MKWHVKMQWSVFAFFRGWSIIIIMRTKLVNICGKCSWCYFNSQRNSIIIIVFNITFIFLSNNLSFYSLSCALCVFVCVTIYVVHFHWFHVSVIELRTDCRKMTVLNVRKTIQRTIETRTSPTERLLFISFFAEFVCVCVWVSKIIQNFSATVQTVCSEIGGEFFSSLLVHVYSSLFCSLLR